MMAPPSERALFDARHRRASGIGSYTRDVLDKIFIEGGQLAEACDLIGDPSDLATLARDSRQKAQIWTASGRMYSLKEQVELRNILKSQHPKLFWTPHYPTPILPKATRLLITVHDVLHLLTRTNAGPSLLQRQYATWMIQRSCRRADSILTVSEFTASSLGAFFPEVKSKIVCAPFGISEAWLAPLVRAPSAETRPYIVYVGNVKPHKNLSALLDAFAAIGDSEPELDLVLVGGAPRVKTVDRVALSDQSVRGNRVRLLGGVSFEELRRTVAGARLLVAPSLYEGLGLTPLEAMAVGTPTLVSRIPAHVEACGEATFFFDPRNTQELKEAILRIAREPQLREDLVERGRERALSRTSTAAIATSVEVALQLLKAG